MRDMLLLAIHLLVTLAELAKPEPRGLLLIGPRCSARRHEQQAKRHRTLRSPPTPRALIRFLSWLASRPSAVSDRRPLNLISDSDAEHAAEIMLRGAEQFLLLSPPSGRGDAFVLAILKRVLSFVKMCSFLYAHPTRTVRPGGRCLGFLLLHRAFYPCTPSPSGCAS